MEFVKLQCNICWSIGEIKKNNSVSIDNINILPIAELFSCKHQLCLMCIRKIRKKKKIVCPMCRCENGCFNIYSVTRNIIDYIKCDVNNINIWNASSKNNSIDAASFGSVLFENSLYSDEDEKEVSLNTEEHVSLIESKLLHINQEITKQNTENIKQMIECQKLEKDCDFKKKIVSDYENKINKIRLEYNNLIKKNKNLKLKHITAEKALEAINKEHVKILNKNQSLINQNKLLSNKNIELIKHKNLLQKEYTTFQKTYTCITKSTIITTKNCNQ